MSKATGHLSRQASCGREERSSTGISPGSPKDHSCIKLGIDVHAAFYMVARQIDQASPERPRKITPDQFEPYVMEQMKRAEQVHSCYEAGCFGYVLHRRLVELGVKNLVIRPQNLDEQHTRVNTDRTDALALLSRLDRYLAGNTKALAVVRVPSLAEEVHRSRVRGRQTFRKEVARWGQRGRGTCRNYGIACPGKWWRQGPYQTLLERVSRQFDPRVARPLLEVLSHLREMVQLAEQKLMELTQAIEKAEQTLRQERRQAEHSENAPAAASSRIKGLGWLSLAKLGAEICDWKRFSNRRQVASYTGLCPGVSGSGGRFIGLSITRRGNAALRADLVELAWLVVRYQPNYKPLRQRKHLFDFPGRPGRKKAIVAIARHLAIDLWRIETGRATAEQLGLQLIQEAA